jgi:2-desacetyl-2-hydroxyethyl bacteriochlorophyllide A dehydrogenase
MRAAFCPSPRQIELREISEPVADEQNVVVRVHACGICGSDLHYYCGAAPPPRVPLGHEISGTIADAGVSDLAIGDRVVVEPLIACGICARCRTGEPNLCPRLRILGNRAPGGLADQVAVPASSVYRVPAEIDLDTAMLTEPLAVGVHAADLAEIQPGESVLVLGAGAIGLLAAFAAVERGGEVTISARYRHQAAAAFDLGVRAVIDTDRSAILAACAAHQPDVVLETVGGAAVTLDLALEVVRPGGRIVGLGIFSEPIALHPLRFLVKEVRLVSSMTYRRSGRQPDFAHALDLLARERNRLARLITHRVPLRDVARGFETAADKATGAIKVVVLPSQG